MKDNGIDYSTNQEPEDNLSKFGGFRNFMTALHELCAYNQMPGPKYELEQEIGEGFEKEFSFMCTLGENVVYGYGRSKRAAKLKAAEEMWNILKAAAGTENQEYAED